MASRRTLRTRLVLVYTGLFVVSGAVLLLIINGLVRSGVTSVRRTVPVPPDLPRPGRVLVGPPTGGDMDRFAVFSLLVLALMAVASIALGWLVANRFLRPLRDITAKARQISATNLHERLDLDGPNDEINELGATLDELFARLESSFESQRRFVANASHELRTPLTAERALLQVTLADPDASAATLRATCDVLLTLGEQQERLIGALLTLATSEQGLERSEPLDVADIAGRVVEMRRGVADAADVEIDLRLDPAPATGDPSLAESLVANLVDNAIAHNVAGGRIEVCTVHSAAGSTLAVRNTGPVVAADELDRLFEPFHQAGTPRVGHEGHGLGLAIVQAIATAHRAELTARARPEGGLDIEVTFPPS